MKIMKMYNLELPYYKNNVSKLGIIQEYNYNIIDNWEHDDNSIDNLLENTIKWYDCNRWIIT
jgi:hypothetical protein